MAFKKLNGDRVRELEASQKTIVPTRAPSHWQRFGPVSALVLTTVVWGSTFQAQWSIYLSLPLLWYRSSNTFARFSSPACSYHANRDPGWSADRLPLVCQLRLSNLRPPLYHE